MAIFEKKVEEKEQEQAAPAQAASVSGFSVILQKPRISEKASKLSESGKYVFEVLKKANKISVKRAIEKAYNVRVVRVNMLNTMGKTRTYGKASGKRSDFKKAIVTLKEGDKIETGQSI